jgi:hypothetical protein
MPSRDEVVLEAARKRATTDLESSAQSILKLMEVARPRGFGALELERAQAVAYLDLHRLYEALRWDVNSDELWDQALLSIARGGVL